MNYKFKSYSKQTLPMYYHSKRISHCYDYTCSSLYTYFNSLLKTWELKSQIFKIRLSQFNLQKNFD